MGLGSKIQEGREKNHFSRRTLARILCVDEATIEKWETDKDTPSQEAVNRLSEILNIPADYLAGISDDPLPARPSGIRKLHTFECTKVAVLNLTDLYSNDSGIKGIDRLIEQSTAYTPIPLKLLGPVGKHKPFVIDVDENMLDTGIPRNAKIAVNPEADIINGIPALLRISPRGKLTVKWVYWKGDGGVELKSENPDDSSHLFSTEDMNNNLCEIIGTVVTVITIPLRAV